MSGRLLRGVLLGVALLAVACSGGGPADPGPPFLLPPPDGVVEGQMLVRLAPTGSIDRVNARYGTRTLETLEDGRTYLLGLPEDVGPAEMTARMAGDPELVAASPNPRAETPEAEAKSTMAFADPALATADYVDQAALARIGVPAAWATTRGAGVVVAVLDTGVDPDHPALAGRVLPGFDFVDGDADASERGNGVDEDKDGLVDEAAGHGTFVAGLVLAVAPEARILPVRVLNADGLGTADDIVRGLEFARERGARVANLSLGMEVESDVMEDRIREAVDRGLVVVASAGNLGSGERRYPAGSNEVLGVAALEGDDRRAPFSNFGSWVRVAAPGVGLLAPWLAGGFAVWSGTSFSAALVSGAAALLIAAEPSAEPDDIHDALERSAVELPGELGEGRIDVAAALEELADRLR